MSLTYSDNAYKDAYTDTINQEGFSEELNFKYHTFSFYLNITESLDPTFILINYCLSCDASYIEWINLVGFDDKNKTIVFVGFFYCESKGFTLQSKTYYPFDGW